MTYGAEVCMIYWVYWRWMCWMKLPSLSLLKMRKKKFILVCFPRSERKEKYWKIDFLLFRWFWRRRGRRKSGTGKYIPLFPPPPTRPVCPFINIFPRKPYTCRLWIRYSCICLRMDSTYYLKTRGCRVFWKILKKYFGMGMTKSRNARIWSHNLSGISMMLLSI